MLRLARLVSDICADCELADARSVLTEVLVSLPVYRAYVNPGELPSDETAAVVRGAVDAARGRLARRLHRLAEEVGAAALGTHRPVSGAAGRTGEFTVRFQQTSGPVQAKGVEDTAFYRWFRLVSLNEVGGDPGLFGVPPEEFHATAGRLAGSWPGTMTTLSTHDTKRQEDVRARLAVLAEMPSEWGQQVMEWHERAVPPQSSGSGGDAGPAVDAGHRIPALADPGRGVADQPGKAHRLPDQGDPRGQAADLVDRPRPRLRGGGARPGIAGAV